VPRSTGKKPERVVKAAPAAAPQKPKVPEKTPVGFLIAWSLKLALVLGMVALMIWGLISVGEWSREKITDDPRHFVRFLDIEVDPPTGLDRRSFLEEVRFSGQMPNRFNLLEPKLHDVLKVAFAKHPRVQSVEEVLIGSDRSVKVVLKTK
jgi:hypothetical protein